MEIEAAKSYDSGIDFVSRKNCFTIYARRDANGKVSITKKDTPVFSDDAKKNQEINLKHFFIILSISLFITLTLHLNVSMAVKVCIYMVSVWLVTFVIYYLRSKKETDFMQQRYHAAEHKVLNYLDRYHKAPIDIYELKNTSSISFRCSATMIAVVYAFVSLSTLSIIFLSYTGLKVVGCILSFLVVFLLWGLGYLDFFQKFVIKEPTIEEMEVAYAGMLAYINEMVKF